MKGWGAQDDFQEQIQATVDERLDIARAELRQEGTTMCVDCEKPIDPERRKAMPSAIRCIKCQEAYES